MRHQSGEGELRWAAVTYNTLSTVSVGRWDDIDNELAKFHIIGLQGTRAPGKAVVETNTEHFFGLRGPLGTNKHAGVAIGLHRSRFKKKHIVQIFPTPKVADGRLLGVRLRAALFDIAIISLYLPVGDRVLSGKLVEILSGWLANLPGRCLPIVLGDFNAKFGLQKDVATGLWAKAVDVCIGEFAESKENPNATLLRHTFRSLGLAVATTHHRTSAGRRHRDTRGLPQAGPSQHQR